MKECTPQIRCVVYLKRIKRKIVGGEVKGVGVMKDEDLKLEEIEVSHTLSVVTSWSI